MPVIVTANRSALKVGDEVTLKCNYASEVHYTSISIEWKHQFKAILTCHSNNDPLDCHPTTDARHVVPIEAGAEMEHALRIYNVEPSDEGYYSCYVMLYGKSRHAEGEGTVQLTVAGTIHF